MHCALGARSPPWNAGGGVNRRRRPQTASHIGASRRRSQLIGLREARKFVFDACLPLQMRALSIESALGCVLAKDALAVDPVPPFVNSSMDGYALHSGDTSSAPVKLRVVGTTYAGDPQSDDLPVGAARRVMTGAPLPHGADAVCMVELTRELGPDEVEICVRLSPGENVREAGADVEAGKVCVTAGTALAAAHLGVLIGAGVDSVQVIPRPRVGVISTGDELVAAGAPLAPGKIRDSNRPTLLARLHDDGFRPIDLGSVVDEAATIACVIDLGTKDCDAIVTLGGVSVGEHDYLAEALNELDASPMRSMQVAIRPAKPFAFGILSHSRVPVFGLPGNPVSALVSYELIVRPALRTMAGHRAIDRPVVSAIALSSFARKPDGRTNFVRVTIRRRNDGSFAVHPTSGQGSHQLRGFADADGLAIVADGEGIVPGENVEVLVLRDEVLAPETDATWMP